MRTTVAIVERKGQDFALAEVELDAPRADEVLVRIVATGLCHTDLTAARLPAGGDVPATSSATRAPGVVEAVGADVTGIEVGDHVVLSFRVLPGVRELHGRPGRLLRVQR